MSGQDCHRPSENTLQILESCRFLTLHEAHSVFPTRFLQFFGHRRMDGAEIRVASDIIAGPWPR